ncbi:MAG: ATP-binding cassette domain-containing protein, partial [Pseudomonadota bacterium]|nr:ATP-binding cassette domain-containing protein [Pseudomonadota bacterium]
MSALDLKIEGLTAGYGDLRILHDISLAVTPGEAVCIIGRNGMGKTTLLNSVAGRTVLGAGTLRAGGQDLRPMSRVALARYGIGLVPQEREVFANLTVDENLRVADQRGAWTRARVYDLFPRLAERRGNLGAQLSGGEQQMLSIGR